MIGVWMWPESVRIEGAQGVVSRCLRIGVTDIFFLSKGLAGTVSFRSRFAPSCCGRDLLAELLDTAHAAGIRVHAWLTSASDEHYKTLHPESGRFHLIRGRDKALISLTDKGYVDCMQHIIAELCRSYPIDGLHLDYIRYNHLLYGWSAEDCMRYAAEGADLSHLHALMKKTFLLKKGKDPDCIFDAFRAGDESILALAHTRRKDVVLFAKAMIAAAKNENPSLILSAALMPEGAYEDTAFADLHYGQNYEDAAALYDLALPMAYSKAYGKDAAWVQDVALGTMRRKIKTLAGLHAYDGGTARSLKADITSLKGIGLEGICLFRYGAFILAIAENNGLHLINPTNTSVTQIRCTCKDSSQVIALSLLPGKEISLSLPFMPDDIDVFSGDTPVCAYLSNKHSAD
jgi:hypothetical protein